MIQNVRAFKMIAELYIDIGMYIDIDMYIDIYKYISI